MTFKLSNLATSAINVTTISITVVLTVFVLLAAIVLLCRFVANPINKNNLILVGILLVGFLARLAFALTVRGERSDYSTFTDMFDDLAINGVGGYYSGDSSSVLYPIVYFVYLIFGGFANITGITNYVLGTQFMVKLPLIVCDLLSAFAIYLIAKKYFNQGVAYVACGIVACCPAFMIASAVWTSPIVFVVTFLLFACYALAKKQYALTIVFSTAAAFSGKEGIYFFPVVAVFSIYHMVRGIRNIVSDKPQGGELLKSDYSGAIAVPVSFVASLAVVYCLALLCSIKYTANPFKLIYEFTIMPLVSWRYFAFNSLSIYTLFNKNGVVPSARFPYGLFVGIFAVITISLVCVVYFTKRNRATLVMLSGYLFITLQLYYPGIVSVGASTVLIVLASYLLVKDKRLLYVAFTLAILYCINSMSVLGANNFLNNDADYLFDSVQQTVVSGGYSVVNIVCSVLAVIVHLYFTYVTISVGMGGDKHTLIGANNIGKSYKDFFGGRGNVVENK